MVTPILTYQIPLELQKSQLLNDMKYKSIEGKFINILGKIHEVTVERKKWGGVCCILNNFSFSQIMTKLNKAAKIR